MTFHFSAAELERRTENFLRAIDVRHLLVNVCGPCFEQPELRIFRVGIGGGYTDKYGGRHEEEPQWPRLQEYILGDKRVQAALVTASKLGLHSGRFAQEQFNAAHGLHYVFTVSDDACLRIRARAFADKRLFPGDDAEWQRKFELYLKQNWTRDAELRRRYRAEEDLVDWPPPPPEIWPLPLTK